MHCPPSHYRTFTPGRRLLGRLLFDADPWLAMRELAEQEKIEMAEVTILGATRRVVMAYYDQSEHQYHSLVFPEPMEITHCWGTISPKDGAPFPHLHIILGDEQGQTWSGHLSEGSRVFAAEFSMVELLGPPLTRGAVDPETGLTLWQFPG